MPVIESELKHLAFKLHTLFHDLWDRKLLGFSDSPLTPMNVLFTRGDAYREALAAGADPMPLTVESAAEAFLNEPMRTMEVHGGVGGLRERFEDATEWVIVAIDVTGKRTFVRGPDMGEDDHVLAFNSQAEALVAREQFEQLGRGGFTYAVEPAPECGCILGNDMSITTCCTSACPLHGDPEWGKLQGATVLDPKGLLEPLDGDD